MQCYWKVMSWDADGKASAWSKPAEWTMGLLNPEDWQAKWIGKDESFRLGNRAVDLVSRGQPGSKRAQRHALLSPDNFIASGTKNPFRHLHRVGRQCL